MADTSEQQQLADLEARGLATAQEIAEARRLLQTARRQGRSMSVSDAVTQAAAFLRDLRADQTPGDEVDRNAIEGSDLQLVSRIGRGTQAVVYKCRQVTMDRFVAVKFLHLSAARDPELRERFFQEARHAAKLSHPNIVGIHQIRPYKDTFYIVMELVDGGSLAELLTLRKRLDVPEAVGIIRAAAEGLAYAHKNGIVHRDIKPKNLLLTEGGLVKLADLGLARRTDTSDASLDKPGRAYGTPYYIAPEQIAADPKVDGRADIYSLGATFYEMVTGRPPFTAPTPREVLRKHMTEPPPDPRTFVPSLPTPICNVLTKCLTKRPEDRYQTAEELIAALDGAFASGGDFSDLAGRQELVGQIAALAEQRRLAADGKAALAKATAPKPAAVPQKPCPPEVLRGCLSASAPLPRLSCLPWPPIPWRRTATRQRRPRSSNTGSRFASPAQNGPVKQVVTPTVAVIKPRGHAYQGNDRGADADLALDQVARGAAPRHRQRRRGGPEIPQGRPRPGGPRRRRAGRPREGLLVRRQVVPRHDRVPGRPERAGPPVRRCGRSTRPSMSTGTRRRRHAYRPRKVGPAKTATTVPGRPPVPVPPKPLPNAEAAGRRAAASPRRARSPSASIAAAMASCSQLPPGRPTRPTDRTRRWDSIGDSPATARRPSTTIPRCWPTSPRSWMSAKGPDLKYEFDLPPGRYTVTVTFVEYKYAFKTGRVFGFGIPNAKYRADLDIYDLAKGRNKPWSKMLTSVPVTAGEKLAPRMLQHGPTTAR